MSLPRVPRRQFLATGLGLASAAAVGPRVLGANDRIGIGLVGCGSRGTYLLDQALAAAPGQIQLVGLCDVWKLAREKMAASVGPKLPGQQPRLVSRHQDLLALPGLDAVIIATPDHAHCGVLRDAVRAGKDAFVEKPLSVRLEDAASALDIVQASNRIVQVGTQRRSSAFFKAAEQYVRSGALGQITKVETAWNRNVASWNRSVETVREEDVDWQQYQVDLPKRPFDPIRYRCWQWYYDYTTGLVGLLGSHMIDVAQWFLDDPFPSSAVAMGGHFAWKDGREISDTSEYVLEYPKEWLLTFSSRLGSGPEEDFEVFYGKERSLDSRDWVSRTAAHRRAADATDVPLTMPPDEGRSHVGNWIDCMRSRQAPNAPIQAGFAHAVACCLGREAERTGRRVRYDAAARRIVAET
jgi:predicted dehydrogenase